jgi:hypothetical protein
MCWNANASLISFIVGTLINISVMLYFKNTIVAPICIIWQWVLMMQISEYFIWKGQDKIKEKGSLTLGSRSSLIFNVTQPLVVFLCFILNSKVKMSFKITASIVILFYVSFMLINLNIQKEYKSLKPSPNCKHMSLQWWNDIKNSGIIYLITLITIILLLLRPFSLCIFIVSYLIITLIISSIFYSCGNASMWCWLVVPFPIILGIFYKEFLIK